MVSFFAMMVLTAAHGVLFHQLFVPLVAAYAVYPGVWWRRVSSGLKHWSTTAASMRYSYCKSSTYRSVLLQLEVFACAYLNSLAKLALWNSYLFLLVLGNLPRSLLPPIRASWRLILFRLEISSSTWLHREVLQTIRLPAHVLVGHFDQLCKMPPTNLHFPS